MCHDIQFFSLVFIFSYFVSEFHEDVQQNKLFLQFDKRDQKLAHEVIVTSNPQPTTNP